MRLTVEDVTVELDTTTILTGAALAIEAGEFVGLVGPNGSGKSTLLRTIYRALRPVLGAVRVGNDDVWTLSARESALRTAVVVQESTGDFYFEVFDVVAMGRNPHKGPLDRETAEDERICLEAAHCDRVYVLEAGRVVAAGPPRDVLTADLVARVFGVRLRDWTDPETGRTHLSFDPLVVEVAS